MISKFLSYDKESHRFCPECDQVVPVREDDMLWVHCEVGVRIWNQETDPVCPGSGSYYRKRMQQ